MMEKKTILYMAISRLTLLSTSNVDKKSATVYIYMYMPRVLIFTSYTNDFVVLNNHKYDYICV